MTFFKLLFGSYCRGLRSVHCRKKVFNIWAWACTAQPVTTVHSKTHLDDCSLKHWCRWLFTQTLMSVSVHSNTDVCSLKHWCRFDRETVQVGTSAHCRKKSLLNFWAWVYVAPLTTVHSNADVDGDEKDLVTEPVSSFHTRFHIADSEDWKTGLREAGSSQYFNI